MLLKCVKSALIPVTRIFGYDNALFFYSWIKNKKMLYFFPFQTYIAVILSFRAIVKNISDEIFASLVELKSSWCKVSLSNPSFDKKMLKFQFMYVSVPLENINTVTE